MRRHIVLVLTVLLVGVAVCTGQTGTGFPTFGSFSGGKFDTVNEGNLNVHFSIPVVAKTGRGLPIHYNINYDSTGWYPSYWTNGTAYSAQWVPPSDSNWGWNFSQTESYEPMSGYVTYSEFQEPPQSCVYHSMIIRQNYTYHDPQGTAHVYHTTALEADCYTNQSHGFGSPESAADQSGYSLYVDSSLAASIITPDGTLIHPPEFLSNMGQFVQGGSNANPTLPSMVTDVNGNQITNSGSNYTDTLGVVAVEATGNSVKYPSPTSPISPITYVGATINYTNYTVRTNFGCSGVTDYPATVVALVSSIVLADGSQYTFGYEQTPGYSADVTSRIASITLPSGGTITYKYTPSMNSGIVCADGSAAMLSRTTPDGIYTYTRSVTQTGFGTNGPGQVASSVTTETDPVGNKTVINFGNNDTYEIKRQIYNGSSTLLETIETCLGVSFPCTAPGSQPFTSRTVRHEFPDSTGKVSQTYTLYTYGGEVTDVYDYDFGTGGPGALLRHTNTTYASLSASIFYDVNNPTTSEQVSVTDHPSVVTVYDGSGNTMAQTTYAYDETTPTPTSGTPSHVPVTGSRGNPTTITQLVQGTTTIHGTKTYYDTGMLSTEVDPNGNPPTTYTYGTGSCGGAFPTLVTNAVGFNTLFSWDCNGGVMTSTTDLNSQITSYSWTDPNYWRLSQISYPDGGQKTATYNTSSTPWNIVESTKITTSVNLTTKTIYDSQARVSQQQLTSDPEGTTYTDTTYDADGRLKSVSNPYRSTSDLTYGITTFGYDSLNRKTLQIQPDGSKLQWCYNNIASSGQTNCSVNASSQTNVSWVDFSDEVGNHWQRASDALGRMTAVMEPNGSTSTPSMETDYQYDALGNLICAVQKGTNTTAFTSCSAAPSTWRPRSFVYDLLSRLTSAANPERGTITYSYDANGNLKTKTAPSPNQAQTGTATVATNYTYDALNRITGKTYNDSYTSNPATLPVIYGYDGKAITGCPADTPPSNTDSYPKGRRTSMCDSSEAATWTHDQMGRIRQESRSIGTIIGQHDNDTYNLDGSVATTTSLGFQYSYTYNGAGRPIAAVGGTAFIQSGSVTYAPFGGLTSAKLGPQPIIITNAYNNRLQPLLISAAASSSIISLCYDFHLVNVPTPNTACSLVAGSGDNGNIFQIVNNRDNNRSQNFLYDSLNRISQAYTSGPNWGETFTIDAWANLTNKGPVSGKTYTENFNAAPANTKNQLNGYCYDAAGNLVLNSPCPSGGFTPTYTYDAENRLIATAGMSYKYDGDGERVEKCTAGTTPGTCAANATGTLYWTGWGSDPLAETDLAGNVLENYIFFNGQRIARREPGSTPTIHFYFSDHLGSHGVVTDKTGSTCEQDIDYYPYGGVENDYCGTVPQHYKFTGKERDAESGLDYFDARHNASSLGRFMSPDPVHILKQKLVDPQQWNMYAYVRNNPLRFVDPKGKWIELTGTDEERKKQLEALQGAVGKQVGQYLYDNAVTTTDANGNKVTNHYVGIRDNGPDGKGPSFGSINAAANKVGGIIGDTQRGAIIALDTPGRGSLTGSMDAGRSPGVELDGRNWAVIHLTAGDIGTAPQGVQSNGKPYSPTLADVLSHELGQLDADWYHGGMGPGDRVADGDAVRMENQTRQLNGEPLRTGHNKPNDVDLSGMPF